MSELFTRDEYRRIKRAINILLVLPMVAFTCYAATMYYLSVQQKTKQVALFLEQDNVKSERMLAACDSNYYKLLSEESFLRSRAAMIAQDFACLSIDLNSKAMMIELQGIQIHKTLISAITQDKSLANTSGFYWAKALSYPLTIDSSISSISKITFLEKQAPRDTYEIQSPPQLPDTALNTPVFFTLFLSNGLTLNVIQENSRGLFSYKKYAFLRRLDTARGFLISVLRFEIPEYRPQITIEIPARDARTIYKAIPDHALLAFRIS